MERVKPMVKWSVWLVFCWLMACSPGAAFASVRPNPPALNLPSQVAGGGGYAFQEAFPGLPSVNVVSFAIPPGETNRLFLADKAGIIWVITNLASPNLSVFLDLSAKTVTDSECGLTGVAFHPWYSLNGQFYVFYSTLTTTPLGTGLHQRVAQFSVDFDNPNQALPDSEVPLITQYDRDPEHQGGTLQFGPDGYLYIGVGDEGGNFDSFNNAQRIDGNFFSGILRIDVDRLSENIPPNPHPAVNPGTYFVPADNPFWGLTSFRGQTVDPQEIRTEFYAIGFRNPFRFAFDPVSHELFVNDVGQNEREEIDRAQAGGNYGWHFYEGTLPSPAYPPVEPLEFQSPTYEYQHEGLKIAITAGLPYRGTKYPELDGAYVFFDFGGSMGILRNDRAAGWINQWLPDGLAPSGVSDLIVLPSSGDILIGDYLFGAIYRLIPNRAQATTVPAKLSQTGIFEDLTSLTPTPGLEPYEVNVPFWSDGATKRRWFALPSTNAYLTYTSAGAWQSPSGTVWVKHFNLDVLSNSIPTTRKIETRVLVRTDTGVYGATYQWRDDQSDADLVPAGGSNSAFWVNRGGTNHLQTWHFPAQSECTTCHNSLAGFSLGFNTPQLNRSVVYDDIYTNQIAAWADAGYFSNPPVAPAYERSLKPLDSPGTSRRWLARSFLAANCSACHFPNGPTRATWDARPEPDLSDLGIVGVSALENLSDPYNVETDDIVSPGNLDTSVLYRRLADFAPYHMPPLATKELDTVALPMLAGWITNDLVVHQSYQTWVQTYFPSNAPPSVVSPTADPDGDGLPNMAEWLLSQDPTNPRSTWSWSIQAENDGFHLQFLRLADVAFQIEVSDSAGIEANWQPLAVPGNEWQVTANRVPVDLVLPTPSTGQAFYRVTMSEP